MRAIELQTFGDPQAVFTVADYPEPPPPGAGEILIGMAYAPVNLNDLLVMQGVFPLQPARPGPIGNEGVGRVLAIGTGVTDVSVGDVVLLPLYSLTWRERLIVPASDVVVLPAAANLQQLSMLRINAVTAALMLTHYVDMQAGDWLIQNAGNSAVAHAVTAIAASRGLHMISLVRRADAIAGALAAGADAAFVDDDTAPAQIAALVGKRGIRLALDGVGGAAAGRLAATLHAKGTLVSYAVLGGDLSASVNMLDVIFKDLTYRGFYLDKPEYATSVPALVAEAARLVASGQLHVPIAAVYPMEALGTAIAHVQRGGKVLLAFGGHDTAVQHAKESWI